jgi:hypothetical protein
MYLLMQMVVEIVSPVRINFSSSSIRGNPLLSYKDAELDLNFESDEITRLETSLGTLVTAPWRTLSTPSSAVSLVRAARAAP